jgi:hypothetical protein
LTLRKNSSNAFRKNTFSKEILSHFGAVFSFGVAFYQLFLSSDSSGPDVLPINAKSLMLY